MVVSSCCASMRGCFSFVGGLIARQLPKMQFGSVHVRTSRSGVVVTNSRNEKVRARRYSIYITASYSLARRSKGLCGNFNGNWKGACNEAASLARGRCALTP